MQAEKVSDVIRIPFSLIADKAEGDRIVLECDGNSIEFTCQQKQNGQEIKFESMTQQIKDTFCREINFDTKYIDFFLKSGIVTTLQNPNQKQTVYTHGPHGCSFCRYAKMQSGNT